MSRKHRRRRESWSAGCAIARSAANGFPLAGTLEPEILVPLIQACAKTDGRASAHRDRAKPFEILRRIVVALAADRSSQRSCSCLLRMIVLVSTNGTG